MEEVGLALTIKYRTTRSEILKGYWQRWCSLLWKYHLAFVIVIFSSVLLLTGRVLIASFVCIVVISLFIVYPQIMYKSNLRTLTVSETGIFTIIGKRSAEIPWDEVCSVQDLGNNISIQRQNGNAFLIPNRAFASETERLKFFDSICNWYQIK